MVNQLIVNKPTINPTTHFFKVLTQFLKICNFTKKYKITDKLIALKPKNKKIYIKKFLTYPDKIRRIIKINEKHFI